MLRSYLFYRCPTCRAPWTNAVLAAAERQASQQLLNGVCPLVVVQEERDDRTNNAQAGKSTENTEACGAAGRTVVGVLVSERRSGITRVTGLTRVAGIDRGRRRCGLERRADIPLVVLQSEAIEGAVAVGATTPDRATVATQSTASECLYILAILLPYERYPPNVIEFVWHCRVAQSTVIITNERRGFTVAE